MTVTLRDRLGRGTLGALLAFYLLVAFEFFYMASPFAAYLYGVYRPGSTRSPTCRWELGSRASSCLTTCARAPRS